VIRLCIGDNTIREGRQYGLSKGSERKKVGQKETLSPERKNSYKLI
jgi:hypothetical protein